jgi:hypothetical protein
VSLLVMLVLSCSSSEGSSGSCGGATPRCEINATATVCGDRITLECFGGATPDAQAQCQVALEQADESVYCCTSAIPEAAPEPAGDGGGGGGPVT